MNRAAIRRRLESMSPANRARVRQKARTLRRHRRQHPLAHAKLWHRNAPRTSQREAIRSVLDSEVLLGFVLGGNRTGKSEAVAMLTIAMALGGDHPDVVRWLRINGLPADAIPPGPAPVFHVALTFQDSRRYCRPKLRRWAPAGSTWRGYDNPNGEAELTLPNGGKVICKADKQGRAGMQGDAVRAVFFDEEPSLDVVQECLMRVADMEGRLIFSMTPLKGWTPLLEQYVARPAEDVMVRWLHGRDNPHVSARFLAKLYAKFGPHMRASREKGEIVALEGRVYPEWRRDLHVVPSFPIPEDWPRIRVWDFGTRNPTCVTWQARDPSDDTVHIYRCHYQAEMTTGQHAQVVKELHGDEAEPEADVADPEAADARKTLASYYGIATVPARKAVQEGIGAVRQRLEPDLEGKPHLVVHDCCLEVIKEIESYVWKTRKSGEEDQPDKPLKRADHAMDTVRYGAMWWREWVGESWAVVV